MSDLIERSKVIETLRHYLYYGGEDGFMNAIKEIERLPSEERPHGTEFRFEVNRWKENGVEFVQYVTDEQFDPTLRRHYKLEIISIDYDQEDNENIQIIYSSIVHMTRKELEEYASNFVKTHSRKHRTVFARVHPKPFDIISSHRIDETIVSKKGQIGFDL